MMYEIKETAVNQTLVMWWGSVRGTEMFYSHMIRSQSFSEPVPLDCELHMCFSVPSPLKWNRMAAGAGVGVGWRADPELVISVSQAS